MLRDSREGIPLNKAEFYDMDAKLFVPSRADSICIKLFNLPV